MGAVVFVKDAAMEAYTFFPVWRKAKLSEFLCCLCQHFFKYFQSTTQQYRGSAIYIQPCSCSELAIHQKVVHKSLVGHYPQFWNCHSKYCPRIDKDREIGLALKFKVNIGNNCLPKNTYSTSPPPPPMMQADQWSIYCSLG